LNVEVRAPSGLSNWAHLLALLPAEAVGESLTRTLVANAVAAAGASLGAGAQGLLPSPHGPHAVAGPLAEGLAQDPAAAARAEPGSVVAIEPSASSWPSLMLLTPPLAQAEQARAAQNNVDAPEVSRTLAQPHLADPLTAATPLTPQWVSNLTPTPLAAYLWPHPSCPRQPPDDEARPREWRKDGQRQRRDLEPDAWQDNAEEHSEEQTAATELGTTQAAAPINPHARFNAKLPPAVLAELARKRCVLLLGPCAVGAQRPNLDAWCLSFDAAGRPRAQRCAARGALGVLGLAWHQSESRQDGRHDGQAPAWQLWRARRHGQPGDVNSDNKAVLTPRRRADMPLVLRVGDPTRPPPLRDAHSAWLDLLAPQRLWRDMGTQWTLLIAWHKEPL
jgi:hypothetical protein